VQRRTNRELLKAVRQGQREACEELISRHYRKIYRFTAYLSGDASLAEELTQETFTAAWANIDCYKGRAKFDTWLHQIAYHKFIDSRRKLQRDAALITGLKQDRSDTSETLNPLHRLIADEHLRLVYAAMQKLGSSEYVVIVLHYIQGLSFRKTAKVLNQPVGTVKWQSSQALKKLKAYLTNRVR